MNSLHAAGALVGGRYRLLEIAGVGSTSEVWRAEQIGAEGFRREVAVKRMLNGLSVSQTHRAMFVREARVHAQLNHPNIVQVVDFGEDDAGLFLVTEWVEGLSVREIRDLCVAYGVKTSPVLMAAVGIEVLRALEAAHGHSERDERGVMVESPIVHRDLSPSNVLLSIKGVVKLADFGIARGVDDIGLTPANNLLLKLGYAAPEVVAGEPHTPLADLYGCGVMLWEAIVGRPVWAQRSQGELLMALARGASPPPLLAARPDTPPPLAAAVDRATAPRPQDRFPSAAAFARALSDVLRMIPERTDTTRLATEVTNALALQRNLRDQQSRSLRTHGLPEPADDPRPTVELVGMFPTVDPSALRSSPAPQVPSNPPRGGPPSRPTPPERPAARVPRASVGAGTAARPAASSTAETPPERPAVLRIQRHVTALEGDEGEDPRPSVEINLSSTTVDLTADGVVIDPPPEEKKP